MPFREIRHLSNPLSRTAACCGVPAYGARLRHTGRLGRIHGDVAMSSCELIVGVDGALPSWRAAQWALAEAERHSSPVLRVVLVNDDPARTEFAAKTVAEFATWCREALPGVPVYDETTLGHPVEVLARRSKGARLVVLGSRGHGGFADALIGSVSVGVAMNAACPVVVVRGNESEAHPRLVVGIDDSPDSDSALEFAFATAERRSRELVVLQALPQTHLRVLPGPRPRRADLSGHAEQQLVRRLAAWTTRFPNVTLRRIVADEHPVPALLDLARAAQLVVVGQRGSGGFAGIGLGSVARGVLHHSPCPVAVVPSE